MRPETSWPARSRRRWPRSWERHSGPSASSSSLRCRRRAARRSCAARCARRRSGRIRATSRRWRIPSRWRRSRVPSERGIAFVTGGGRGIGAGIARELAEDGWSVVVGARSRDQIEAVANEVGGRAVEVDVSDRGSVERAFAEAGDVELLVANAGIGNQDGATWEIDPADWWRVFEVNVLGVHLCCWAVIPGMLERGGGRIVITGSGAAYLPGASHTAYPASKAAVCRYGEALANELRGRIPVFFFSPGLVKTEMTSSVGDN